MSSSPPRAARPLVFGLSLGLMIGAAGCANHMHDAGNYALAQAAQADFKSLELRSSLDAERKLSDEMLKLELSAVSARSRAMRDEALLELLSSRTWEDLREKTISDRSMSLAGVSADQLAGFLEKINATKSAAQNLAVAEGLYRARFVASGAPEPTCPPSQELKALAAQPIAAYYVEHCTKHLAAEKALIAASANQELGRALKDVADLKEAIVVGEARSKALLKSYKDALKQYENEKPASVEAAKKLAEKLKIAEKLKELEAIGPLGKLAAVTETLDKVNALITSSIKGELTTGGPVPWAAAEILAATVLAFDRIKSDAALPALLLESERLRIGADEARAQIERDAAELSVKVAKRSAMMAEMEALARASTAIQEAQKLAGASAGSACGNKEAKIQDGLTGPDGPCRRKLVEVMIHYANSWTLGRIPVSQASWMEVGLVHARAIDRSAAAMQQWENLLAVPLGEIVRYEATGTTPEAAAQIALQVLQAAGIGLTAGGVLAK